MSSLLQQTNSDDPGRADPLHAPPAPAFEHDLRLALDSIPGLVAILGADGAVELVNQRIVEYFGRTLEELQQWGRGDSVHPDDLPHVAAAWRRSIETGEPLETEHRLRRADGVYRWFQLRARPWRDATGRIGRWYALIIDIDDRRRAEEALQRSEAFLLEAQRLSRTGSWRYDVASGVVESSPEIQRAYSIPPDEDVSGRAYWFERIHPQDRQRVQETFEACERNKTEYRADYRIVLPDGCVRYQHAIGHPTLDAAGEIVEWIGASMDITDHWLAKIDLERASEALHGMQTRLSRAAQVATVGELAASIAHEVNQPLSAVLMNGHACLRWLSASPPNMEKAIEAAERILNDGRDAGEVIRRVRALFKRADMSKLPLDLNQIVREVLRLLETDIARRGVTVETDLDPELPSVLGDRVQLQQLLLNLMLNGLDAMESNVDRPRQLTIRSSRGHGSAMVTVEDNGVGLEDPERAFEPFFTTKAEGMGMGLAICRSIVTAHDGTLSAGRNKGWGTTFAFALPLPETASR